ncbi:MAG TPA: DUF4197 family protein [Proteobacteria bacterium]|nr:DUF4197 family protein [Pseudomonadota bacterium]
MPVVYTPPPSFVHYNSIIQDSFPFFLQAIRHFLQAIRQMTVRDAFGISRGDDTNPTRYFEDHTRSDLYEAFGLIVTATTGEDEEAHRPSKKSVL